MGCANSTPAVTEEVGHPEKVVAALQTLRDSLSHLTPAGQTTVKQSHAFASAEWLDGMAALTKTTVNKGKETSISREASVHAGHQGAFQEARIKLTPDSSKLILVLVGLPARGKSLLGYKLESYLNWRGWRTRTFRVGELRRDQAAMNGGGSWLSLSPAECSLPLALAYLLPLLHTSHCPYPVPIGLKYSK